MTVISLYFLSIPIGLAAIFFAYRASQGDMGRGERTIWIACSYGLLLSMFLILALMLPSL